MTRRENSGFVAKERLKCVLREDRSQMSAATIAAMRADLVQVLASYANVRDEDVSFYLLRGNAENETKLMMEATVAARPQSGR